MQYQIEPPAFIGSLGASPHIIFQVLFVLVFLWVAGYSLVLAYHWLRFGPRSPLVFMGAGFYVWASVSLLGAILASIPA